jgi:hypothetical protein
MQERLSQAQVVAVTDHGIIMGLGMDIISIAVAEQVVQE